jgi:hypothetical protein
MNALRFSGGEFAGESSGGDGAVRPHSITRPMGHAIARASIAVARQSRPPKVAGIIPSGGRLTRIKNQK